MNTHNALMVCEIAVRQDAAGRYCLNDLHCAAGGEARHKPSNWLRLDNTAALIDELSNCSDVSNKPVDLEAGKYGGTYAVRELVYAYAMWISAAFHLRVIRAYDQLVTGQPADISTLESVKDWERAAKIRAAVGTFIAIKKATVSMRMHHERGLKAANRAAIRHHGIDVIAECGAEDRLLPQALAATTLGHSVGAFLTDLLEGDWLEFKAALSTDLHALYARWCSARGDGAATVMRFVEHCKAHGLIDKRVRWVDASGGVKGPHSALIARDYAGQIPTGDSAQRYGAVFAEFRQVSAQLFGE